MPVLADLFGLCGRSDRAPWPLGWLLDGLGARLPLSPLGRFRLRSAARPASLERLVGAALALRTLALRRVSLASAASRLYGLAPVPGNSPRDLTDGRAAPGRARADPLLPADTLRPYRPPVPVFADLFGIYGRGDRAPRSLGGLLDGCGARVPMPSLGRLRLRSSARPASHGRLMGSALALWTLALRRVSLAYDARGLYGLAPFLIQPKRSDRWPSRVGPPKLCLALKAAAS